MKQRILKLVLPTTALVAMVGVAWAMDATTQPPVTEASATPSPTATPTSTPEVTVDGKPVSIDALGNGSSVTSDGTTQVHNSGGQTTVTTTTPGNSTNTVTSNGNLHVTVNQSNGGTNQSYSSTNVSGSGYNSNSSSSYSSTDVFGTGLTTTN